MDDKKKKKLNMQQTYSNKSLFLQTLNILNKT